MDFSQNRHKVWLGNVKAMLGREGIAEACQELGFPVTVLPVKYKSPHGFWSIIELENAQVWGCAFSPVAPKH